MNGKRAIFTLSQFPSNKTETKRHLTKVGDKRQIQKADLGLSNFGIVNNDEQTVPLSTPGQDCTIFRPLSL